jgi:hypothetical protein
MLGNSFLWGIPFFISGKVVQFVLHRSRLVQIGIDGSVDQTDD